MRDALECSVEWAGRISQTIQERFLKRVLAGSKAAIDEIRARLLVKVSAGALRGPLHNVFGKSATGPRDANVRRGNGAQPHHAHSTLLQQRQRGASNQPPERVADQVQGQRWCGHARKARLQLRKQRVCQSLDAHERALALVGREAEAVAVRRDPLQRAFKCIPVAGGAVVAVNCSTREQRMHAARLTHEPKTNRHRGCRGSVSMAS